MREILFRGKSKSINKGEWVYGSFIETIETDEDTDLNTCCIRDKFLAYKLVDKETVGQFTGLTDKNGKKIFEGDLIKGCWGTVFEVYYDDDYLQFRAKTIDGLNNNIDYFGSTHQIEVIGNIY